MRDVPMILSGPMVRATFADLKDRTRRPIKPQPPEGTASVIADEDPQVYAGALCISEMEGGEFPHGVDPWRGQPYGKVGDLLWVREVWAKHNAAESRIYPKGDGHPWGSPVYKATFGGGLAPVCEGFTNWGSPIFMPRWASRLTLQIKSVRVERLQEITEEDARAEGFGSCQEILDYWDTLYAKKPEFKVVANPWVWVIEFTVFKANVDVVRERMENVEGATCKKSLHVGAG